MKTGDSPKETEKTLFTCDDPDRSAPEIPEAVLEAAPRAGCEGALRAMFEQASDGIILLDRQGIIIWWNREMERISGLSYAEAVGRKATAIAALLVPKSRAEKIRFRGGFRNAWPAFRLGSAKGSKLIELPIEPRGQSFRIVQLSVFPLCVDNSPMAAAIVRDLTEYREVERDLSETDQRYRSLFENMVEGIFQTTPSGRFLGVNPSFARMLGYDSEEELLANVTDIARDLHMDPAERDEFLRKLDKQGTVRNLEVRYRRKDGSGIWVSINAKADRGRDGSIVLINGFVQDISARKRLEQQLVQSQKMEAVGRLAGGIAHDFNNLLTVIIGNCEILQEVLNGQERGLEELRGIRKTVTFAAALTRRLLAFSRQQILRPAILDLNSVIRNLELMLKRLIGENIELVTALDPGLGRVKTDPGQLEQVVMNLAVNARDAMPNGGQLTLWTTNLSAADGEDILGAALAPGKHVLLQVSDTGLGMSKETLDHLFEPFFTTKEPGHGTGLGLSTVYGIVRQSGGSIAVASIPGKGSCFTITLPRIEDELSPEPEIHPAEVSAGSGTSLVVEDDETVRKLIGTILRSAGYRVLEAGDGGLALELLDTGQQSIDIVVSDVIMPRIGGGKLREAIRRKDRRMPILFVSGYTENDTLFRDDPSEMIGFLPKPFSRDELLGKIRSMLNHKRETTARVGSVPTGGTNG
jgi:PAS domain S-box-containing protein